MLPILTIPHKKPKKEWTITDRVKHYKYAQLSAELGWLIASSNIGNFQDVMELTRVVLSRGYHEMATELMNDAIEYPQKHTLIRGMIEQGVVPNANSLMACLRRVGKDHEAGKLLYFLLKNTDVVPNAEVLDAAYEHFEHDPWIVSAVERIIPAHELKRYYNDYVAAD